MLRRSIRLTDPVGSGSASVEALSRRFDEIRTQLGVPEDFPPQVREAAAAAAAAPLPVETDLTDVPFVTVDPPGSTDLDQAMCLPGG